MTMTIEPYTLTREAGPPIWFLGTLMTLKATGEQTNGAYGLIEQILPPRFASPLHVHHSEDEASIHRKERQVLHVATRE